MPPNFELNVLKPMPWILSPQSIIVDHLHNSHDQPLHHSKPLDDVCLSPEIVLLGWLESPQRVVKWHLTALLTSANPESYNFLTMMALKAKLNFFLARIARLRRKMTEQWTEAPRKPWMNRYSYMDVPFQKQITGAQVIHVVTYAFVPLKRRYQTRSVNFRGTQYFSAYTP